MPMQTQSVPRPRFNRFILKTLEYMVDNVGEPISMDDLELAAGTSKYHLCRMFTKTFGVPPIRLLWGFRANLAYHYLQMAPDFSLTDIATVCGFQSSAHFSRTIRQIYQACPSRLKAKFEEQLRVSVARTTCESFQILYGKSDKQLWQTLNQTIVQNVSKKSSDMAVAS